MHRHLQQAAHLELQGLRLGEGTGRAGLIELLRQLRRDFAAGRKTTAPADGHRGQQIFNAGVDGDRFALARHQFAGVGKHLHVEGGVLDGHKARNTVDEFFQHFHAEVDVHRCRIVVNNEFAACRIGHRREMLDERARTGTPVIRCHHHHAGVADLGGMFGKRDRQIGAGVRHMHESRHAATCRTRQHLGKFLAFRFREIDRLADVHRMRDQTNTVFDQKIDLLRERFVIDLAVRFERRNGGADDA